MGRGIKLQNVYLSTPDMEASCAFYERLLDVRPAVADGTRWTQYRLGDHNFALSSRDEAAKGAQGATVVFEVAELGAIEELVRELGGGILERKDMGSHGRTITVADPAGSVVQFFARAARGADTG